MKKKQEKRFAKDDTWPFVLRSVRHLHSRVATRKVCLDLCEQWCSLHAEAYQSHHLRDISDISSDAGTDTGSYYRPASLGEHPEDCGFCRIHFGGETTYKMVTMGASAGNPCCVTILDAINTWTKNSLRQVGSKSLLELQLKHANVELVKLPWYDNKGSYTGRPIIQLRWETMSDQERDTDSIKLILFQPTGTTGKNTSYSQKQCFEVIRIADCNLF
jgi:hypothetical protein